MAHRPAVQKDDRGAGDNISDSDQPPLFSPRALPKMKLCLVIPVFGNHTDTLACLRMLAAQSSANFEVVVADDGSPEPPPSWQREFPFLTWQRNPHRGFAGNCNNGAREALRRGATHLLFLNNDTAFGPGFIAAWERRIAALPEALLSPVIYWFDRPDEIWYSGGKRGIHVPFVRLARPCPTRTEVDLLCGCALLLPASAWLALRGFDESFRLYYEDFDLCLRARRLGLHLYVDPDPDLAVRHRVSRSSPVAWAKHFRMITSRYLFIRRHYQGLSLYCCLFLTAPQLAVTVAANLPDLPDWRGLRAAVSEGFTG